MDLFRHLLSAALLPAGSLHGASLFYGDGIITPAIPVLSAVEGLEVATPVLHVYIVPITVGTLIGLSLFLHHGTARVGNFFGPFVVVWFLCLVPFVTVLADESIPRVRV